MGTHLYQESPDIGDPLDIHTDKTSLQADREDWEGALTHTDSH